MAFRDLLRRVGRKVDDEASCAGQEAILAAEREAQRRRDEACAEVAKFESRLERLRRLKLDKEAGTIRLAPLVGIRIAAAKYQLGLAEDRCAALHPKEDG